MGSTFDDLIKMADGFMVSKALFATVKMGVYTFLEGGKKSTAALAEHFDADPRKLSKLLDVCAALDLLQKSGDDYSNTELSSRFLVEGKLEYFGYYCDARNDLLYDEWSNLETYVKGKQSHVAVEGQKETIVERVAMDPEFARRGMTAQHNYSELIAKDFAKAVDLSGNKVFLDAGGGTGVFSAMVAMQFPHLTVKLFDRQPVLDVGRQFLDQYGITDKIELCPGDILLNSFPEGADCVLLSGILDGYGEADCRTMIEKIYAYLPQGGRFFCLECVIDDERNGPLFPALFGLLMGLRTPEGDCRSRGEMTLWMQGAGFKNIEYSILESESGPYRVNGMLSASK